MSKHPPFLLHILSASFMVVCLVNLAGIAQIIQSWNWLQAAGITPQPVYVIFKDSCLALAGLAAAALLWARLPFAPRFSQLLAGGMLAWFWVDRLLLTRNPLPFKSHLFPLVISLLLSFFVWISAWLLEPFMRGQPALSTLEESTAEDTGNLEKGSYDESTNP